VRQWAAELLRAVRKVNYQAKLLKVRSLYFIYAGKNNSKTELAISCYLQPVCKPIFYNTQDMTYGVATVTEEQKHIWVKLGSVSRIKQSK